MTGPIVVSYGGGTNSTAMLIELARRGERVDLILFADTGGERPGTYKFIDLFSDWLESNLGQGITTVRTTSREGDILDLETECKTNGRLPSLAYGFKKCSQKFKIRPQDKFVNNWQPAADAWARGEKVTKLIGFDADEPGRALRQRNMESDKWAWRHPLIEWNWGREECVAAIEGAGLPSPGKSSCFFCPAMKPKEILRLNQCHPELLERALEIERAAAPNCRGAIVGLGRDWTWESLVQADKAQLKMFKNHTDTACGCYDG
jgi:hypothetical protein